MRNYEVTFIVDPVLSGDEVKATAQLYVDWLQKEGAKIVHIDEMGLRQLAYSINKRQSGVYYCVEFEIENGVFMTRFELNLRRDERILRFLTVSLDKFGVKYNEDKRAGKIGKKKKDHKPGITAKPVEKAPEPVPAPVPVAAPVQEPAAVAVEEPAPNAEEAE